MDASATDNHPDFDAFVATIAALRAPDGCPWDREQTHESIAKNMIEEAYEAVDAIEAHDTAHLREELGDVLLQVVLQSQIAADAGEFTIDDVCREVNAKMIRRHPHVFGEAQAADAMEVLDLWDQVKLAEKGTDDATADRTGVARESLLAAVPTGFPALMQAQKISRKAAAAGFEWETLDDVWAKVSEEIAELKEAYKGAPKAPNGKVDAGAAPAADSAMQVGTASQAANTSQVASASQADTAPQAASAVVAVEDELGDVLFSLVNVGRRMGVDAESALRSTCAKFRRRWAYMEQEAQKQGRRVEDLQPDEQELLWNESKSNV